MFRVAVITSYFPTRVQPYRGHTAYQTLRQLTHDLDIKVFSPMAVYPSWFPPAKGSAHPDSTYSPKDVAAHYLAYRAVPGFSRPLNGFSAARGLLPHVRKFRPDLILNYTLYPEGFSSVLLAKELKIPVVLTAVGSDVHSIPDPITRRLTRHTLRNASFVVTVSEDLRQQTIHLGADPNHTRTVRNGIDRSIFRPRDRAAAREALGLDARRPLILFVGWIAPHKGLKQLVTATDHLRRTHPGVKLVCVGEGTLRKELHDTVAAGLADDTLFPGACSSEQVATWMAAADIFCLPSQAEGCPNVVLEALACGRPVVASAVGGIPEILTENCGILVPPGDPQELAKALASALNTKWNSDAISIHSTRTWRDVASEMLNVLCETLSLHNGSRPVCHPTEIVRS